MLTLAMPQSDPAWERKASEVRRRFVAFHPGQESTYLRVEDEAKNLIVDATPTIAEYPYLWADSQANEVDPVDLANNIITSFSAYDSDNSSIEAQRKRGVRQVRISLDEAAAKIARDFAIASLDAHAPG